MNKKDLIFKLELAKSKESKLNFIIILDNSTKIGLRNSKEITDNFFDGNPINFKLMFKTILEKFPDVEVRKNIIKYK